MTYVKLLKKLSHVRYGYKILYAAKNFVFLPSSGNYGLHTIFDRNFQKITTPTHLRGRIWFFVHKLYFSSTFKYNRRKNDLSTFTNPSIYLGSSPFKKCRLISENFRELQRKYKNSNFHSKIEKHPANQINVYKVCFYYFANKSELSFQTINI